MSASDPTIVIPDISDDMAMAVRLSPGTGVLDGNVTPSDVIDTLGIDDKTGMVLCWRVCCDSMRLLISHTPHTHANTHKHTNTHTHTHTHIQTNAADNMRGRRAFLEEERVQRRARAAALTERRWGPTHHINRLLEDPRPADEVAISTPTCVALDVIC